MSDTPDFAFVVAAIDAANAADPERDAHSGEPAALVYGRRMSAELERLHPTASENLRIAARGQHIERWTIARTSYPQGRAGYLAWRTALGRYHARRVGEIMAQAGYGATAREAVGALLRKEGLKANPETQALEDVICFVFVRHYLPAFAAKHTNEDVVRIVAKTARKMSAEGRARMAREVDLPPDLAPAFAPRGAAAPPDGAPDAIRRPGSKPTVRSN